MAAREGNHSSALMPAARPEGLPELKLAVEMATPSHPAESEFGIPVHLSSVGRSAPAARATARLWALPERAIRPTVVGVTRRFLHGSGKPTAGIVSRNPGVRKSGFPASVDRAR